MDPNGSKWIQIDPNESQWIQMDPNRFKCILMEPMDPLNSNKTKWIPMDPNISQEGGGRGGVELFGYNLSKLLLDPIGSQYIRGFVTGYVCPK